MTDHFDFDGTIGLAGFCEHVPGSLAEIAQFRSFGGLLYTGVKCELVRGIK
jgi:hypothetical protein